MRETAERDITITAPVYICDRCGERSAPKEIHEIRRMYSQDVDAPLTATSYVAPDGWTMTDSPRYDLCKTCSPFVQRRIAEAIASYKDLPRMERRD